MSSCHRVNQVKLYWKTRETEEAFEEMMYDVNRTSNPEEKLRGFLSVQEHIIDLSPQSRHSNR